jgi:hypothetical protein
MEEEANGAKTTPAREGFWPNTATKWVVLLGALVAVITSVVTLGRTLGSSSSGPSQAVRNLKSDVGYVKRYRTAVEQLVSQALNDPRHAGSYARAIRAENDNRESVRTALGDLGQQHAEVRTAAAALADVVRAQIATAEAYATCFSSPNFTGGCLQAQQLVTQQMPLKQAFMRAYDRTTGDTIGTDDF